MALARTRKQMDTSKALADAFKQFDSQFCKCEDCTNGRQAARERLAAKGLAPRRLSPWEFQRRMDLIYAAKQKEKYENLNCWEE